MMTQTVKFIPNAHPNWTCCRCDSECTYFLLFDDHDHSFDGMPTGCTSVCSNEKCVAELLAYGCKGEA